MATAVAQLRAGARETLEDFLRLFSSIYFAVSLFAVWGFLTLIGVIVDQGKDAQFYWATYTPALARLVLRLHLDNIYHSPAYVGVIGAIVTSLAVCTFRRVIPARLPPLRPVRVEHIPLHATLPLEGEEATIRERIERFLTERGWSIRKREFNGEEWTFADKHNWARRGVLVAHIGFAIITAGTTWYWAQGFSGDVAIVTGATATIPQTGARFTLQHFAYRFDPIRTKSGLVYQPIDYVSQVRYAGRDGVAREATIRVNQPLDVDGTLYYQASYGFATEFRLLRDGKPVAGIPADLLKEGGALEIGPGRALQYAQFVGTIDRRTGRPTNDPRPNNPGVVVRVVQGDRELGAALLPIGGSIDLGGGFRLSAPRYVVYSGFQYRYDPGMVLVGIGAFVLLSGLCIAFYFLPARLFLRLVGSGRSWELGVAATTVKGYDVFEDQFRDLIGALRRCS
ncbi:MAG: cytochrome c biogenesis protein ResB [Candidatus Eremiobacteraeota bacterium]|nr:cytochrome c biogenesis protein ResB [Candidatus Eremiobacteraeota bacterium]